MRPEPHAPPPPGRPRDALAGAAIFLLALGVFWRSPITQVGDSKYTVLLAQTLLSKGSFRLDGSAAAAELPGPARGPVPGVGYQLETVGGHLYYFFPPGTPVLSAPFVLAANGLGYSVVRADGRYDFEREKSIQHAIASLLMAGLAALFYLTARRALSAGWSAALALGGALGTPVWSTASRSLWTHTWGALLLGAVVCLLLRRAIGQGARRPVLLASLLSWTYFVRPTNAVFIVGVTVYVLLFERAMFWRYAATGAAWFAAFVAYSWSLYGKLLPSYYQPGRLRATHFWEALAGNLVSPSRGLLVCVPVTLWVAYLLTRHWPRVEPRRLVWLALAVGAGHLAAVSGFSPWFGGACYGPRYMTELIPWLVLLTILGLRAALDERAARPGLPAWEWPAARALGAALLLLSAGIQGRGACAALTARWNDRPGPIDLEPGRVWDWQYPQMLAGWQRGNPPAARAGRILFGGGAAQAFQAGGWSVGEADFCWTDGPEATLRFAADDLHADRLRLCFEANLGSRLPRQKVILKLNGQPVATLNADTPGLWEYARALPPGALRRENVLTFQLPDAASPQSVGEGADTRRLGVAVYWLELAGIRPLPARTGMPPGPPAQNVSTAAPVPR